MAASVDDRDDPKFAKIHIIPAAEMVVRFDRAREKKLEVGHVIPHRRGVWLSLYHQEAQEPVNLVGAGAGLAFPAIATVPLGEDHGTSPAPVATASLPAVHDRFTIADAKKRLAAFYDVPEDAITITITH